MICRVILCNRHAVRDSNLCAAHFKQLVDRALSASAKLRQVDVIDPRDGGRNER